MADGKAKTNIYGQPVPDFSKIKDFFTSGRGLMQESPTEFREFWDFLTSVYGFTGAFAIRAEYTFRDITKSPAYKEWARLGKPATIASVPESDRGNLVATTRILQPATTGETAPATEQPATAPPSGEDDDWIALTKRARQIANETGRKYEDVLAELSGLSPAETETGMTEYQTWQKGLQERQFAGEQAQWATQNQRERALQQSTLRWNLANEALQRQGAIAGRQVQPNQDVQKAQWFEEWKQQALGQMAGNPAEWINYQSVKNWQNPYGYVAQPWTVGDEIAQIGQDLKLAQADAKDVHDRLNKANADFKTMAGRTTDPQYDTGGDPAQVREIYQDMLTTVEALQGEAKLADRVVEGLQIRVDANKTALKTGKPAVATMDGKKVYTTGDPEGVYSYGVHDNADTIQPQRQPMGVKTPEWLPRFVPELAGKQFLPRTNIPKPTIMSGQQWSTTDPTQQAMLGGYAQYAGIDPNKYRWQSQQMLPSRRAGARWTPISQ